MPRRAARYRPIRRAAYRLAVHQLEERRCSRIASTITCALFIAICGFVAMTLSPWCWLGTAFFAAVLLSHVRLRARLERRVELLQPAESAEHP